MITKTRTDNSVLESGTQTVVHHDAITGVVIETQVTNSNSQVYPTLTESIEYENPRRKYAGQCLHTKTQTLYCSATPSHGYTQGRRYVYSYTGGYLAKTFLWPRSSYLTAGVLVDSSDWSQLSFRALEAMQPTLNEEDNMLGAFLRDLPRPTSMLSQWRRWKDEWTRDGWRRFLQWRWHQIRNQHVSVRDVAQLNLFYQFGLKPFVSDVSSIYKTLTSLEERIKGMLADAGKLRIKHHSQVLDTVRFPHKGEQEVWRDSGNYHTLTAKYEFVSRPRYTATLTYKLDATELTGLLGEVRGFISAMGLDRFLATLWEFIPYSFAVDWFVDVGSFLDSLDRRLFGALPIMIHSYCDSIKYEYRTTVKYVAMFYTTPLCRVVVGQHNVKRYERRRSIPTLNDLQSANGLTLNRIGLTTSLLSANVGR
jgi:hypothetical protein